MKFGKSVFDEDPGVVFSLGGKPFDGWGPLSVPAAVGPLAATRSCDMNCYLSDGGDCCSTQYDCESCSCQPCVGSACSPEVGCESMTKADFEAVCSVDCTVNPDACQDWSQEPCPSVTALADKQCPQEYHWACRYNDRTKKYGCRHFKKTYLNYLNFCFGLNQCWDTKEECQACADCACNYGKSSSSSSPKSSSSSSSSSGCDVYAAGDETMGTCFWGLGSTTNSEMYCAPMSKGSCAVQEGWGWNPSVPPPMNAIYLNDGKSAWSCDGACPGSCESVPTCEPGQAVKTVTKRSILGYYYQECVCDNAAVQCGSSFCNSCEFCHAGTCMGCDNPLRFVAPYNSSAGDCPYPLGYSKESCGCRTSGLEGYGYERGCGPCEFCTDSAAGQGGVCFPCDKNPYFGTPYDNLQYPDREWQCTPECMNPPSSSSSVAGKNCIWEFTAQYDEQSGSWSFPSQAYSTADCLSPPYPFPTNTWYAFDCTTKLYKKVTSGCVTTSDCVEPSGSEYPDLPTGPAECPKSSSSSSPQQRYDCNYEYDSTNGNTTYSCDESFIGQFNSLATCEEAKNNTINNITSIWRCAKPRFDCTYTGTEFSCYEAISGQYGSLESCQEAIANSGCGYRYRCNAAGDGCEPDLTGPFTGKYQCEQGVAAGNCGKYSCKSYLNFPGTFVECESNPYGVFTSLTDCKQHCCGTTANNESGFPEAIGSCEYYQADSFSPLTPDYKICEAGLTRAQCEAKPGFTLLSGYWGPSWTCGGTCFADQLACPDCPSGRYRTKATYPAGDPVCTCVG